MLALQAARCSTAQSTTLQHSSQRVDTATRMLKESQAMPRQACVPLPLDSTRICGGQESQSSPPSHTRKHLIACCTALVRSLPPTPMPRTPEATTQPSNTGATRVLPSPRSTHSPVTAQGSRPPPPPNAASRSVCRSAACQLGGGGGGGGGLMIAGTPASGEEGQAAGKRQQRYSTC